MAQAVREDMALSDLKQRLSVPSSAQVDSFLLRFLRDASLNPSDACEKLRMRREFECTLARVPISATVVRALQSGAFALLGQDALRRPILLFDVQCLTIPDVNECVTLFIVLMEAMQQQTLTSTALEQECVVIVNDDGAGWPLPHAAALRARLRTVAQKFFPRLVARVIVVHASWAVAQGIRAAAAAANPSVRPLFQVLDVAELKKFVIDGDALPQRLGGKGSVDAMEFADMTLRLWYNVTSVYNSSEGRPLWQPAQVSTVAVERRVVSRRQLDSGRRLSTISRPRVDDDDGVCSMMSATEESWDGDTSAVAYDSPDQLRQELTIERNRRLQLEHEVSRLTLGVTVDGTVLTNLEAQLRVAHEEVNVLVAEVLTRCKKQNPQASLFQLICLLDDEIVDTIGATLSMPAMRSAAVVSRQASRCAIV